MTQKIARKWCLFALPSGDQFLWIPQERGSVAEISSGGGIQGARLHMVGNERPGVL